MTTDLTALLNAMMPDTLVRMHDSALESENVYVAEAIRQQLIALVGEDEAKAMLFGCEAPGPEKEPNDAAVSAFIARIEEARGYVERITQALDDHFDTLPEDVDWAIVGSAAHVAEMLKEAVAFMTGEEE